jgi:hypothetical protein
VKTQSTDFADYTDFFKSQSIKGISKRIRVIGGNLRMMTPEVRTFAETPDLS